MGLGPWEIIAIVVLVVVLFGAKKLPDAARSIGRSMRIFKSEMKEMSNDDKEAISAAPQAAASESLSGNTAANQPSQTQLAPQAPTAQSQSTASQASEPQNPNSQQ